MRKAVLVLVGLSLAAAAVWLSRLLPLPSDELHPFVVTGKSGQVVDGRTFTVKIAPPWAARKLRIVERFGDPTTLSTTAVWLILPVKLDAATEPISVKSARLVSRSGKVYDSSPRVPSSHSPTWTIVQPGVPQIGGLVFEIPPGEIGGAVLEIGRSEAPQLDVQVRIPLDTRTVESKQPDPTADLPEVASPR